MDTTEAASREAIRDTIARYAHAFDRGEVSDVAACFTDDGSLVASGRPPTVGRAAIEERFAAAAARLREAGPNAFVRHHVASTVIDVVDADTAGAYSYFAVYTEAGPDHWGRYLDRFRRVGDRWLLAERQVVVDGRAAPSRLT